MDAQLKLITDRHRRTGLRVIARIIIAGATLIAFVLAVAVIALWVRSFSSHDRAFLVVTGYTYTFESEGGTIYCQVDKASPFATFRGVSWVRIAEPRDPRVSLRSFSGSQMGFRFSISKRLCFMPHWAPALLFFVCFAIGVLALRPRRTRDDSVCGVCGYDLRGTSGRPCPECGHPSMPGVGPTARVT